MLNHVEWTEMEGIAVPKASTNFTIPKNTVISILYF